VKQGGEAVMFKLFSTPQGDDTATVLAERRRRTRFPCDLGTVCQPFTRVPEKCWPGRVTNLSRGGVGLLLHRRFEAGTLLNVQLQLPGGRSAGPLLARVIHVEQRPGGDWLVGGAWIHELSAEDLRAIVPEAE
jgi:hypothetical protein